MSIATDESFVSKTGERVNRTEWHRLVTFQDGLIDMLEKHGKKGRLVHAEGKLQTRRWKKDEEETDRFSTEILIVPGHRLQFLDKLNRNGAQAPADGGTAPMNGAAPRGRTRTSSRSNVDSLILSSNSGGRAHKRSPSFFAASSESARRRQNVAAGTVRRSPPPCGRNRPWRRSGWR